MDCIRPQSDYLLVFFILSVLLMLSVLRPSIASGEAFNTSPNALESLDCVINPSIVADLGSSVPGVLSAVLVDRSDFIQSGDVVAQLESGIDTASLALARKRAALTAEIDLRRINTAFGQRQYKRVEDLFSKQVISTKDMDQTETELKLTQLQLRQAKDNQKLAQLELARAQEVLDRHIIRSPISGVIMDRFKTVGEYIDDQPVVRVAQLSPLHVEVIIPIEQLGKVHKGMMADVWSEAIGGKWQAQVSRVDRVADVASGTYGVRLTLDNPDYKIPAGLRCRINFLAQEHTPPSQPISDTDTANNSEMEKPAPIETVVEATAETVAVVEAETETIAQETTDTLPQPVQCAWLGPYTDKPTALQKATAIQVEGVYISVEQRLENKQTGIKVLSPPFDTKKQANAYLNKLRALGDKDHFLIRSQNNEPHQVSLGLYNGPESAKRRADMLKKKGLDVVIEPRYAQNQQHWLLINGDLSQLETDTFHALSDADLTASSLNCNAQTSL